MSDRPCSRFMCLLKIMQGLRLFLSSGKYTDKKRKRKKCKYLFFTLGHSWWVYICWRELPTFGIKRPFSIIDVMSLLGNKFDFIRNSIVRPCGINNILESVCVTARDSVSHNFTNDPCKFQQMTQDYRDTVCFLNNLLISCSFSLILFAPHTISTVYLKELEIWHVWLGDNLLWYNGDAI